MTIVVFFVVQAGEPKADVMMQKIAYFVSDVYRTLKLAVVCNG